MSAFLSGMGKALTIWPNTDYSALFSKKSPTQEAWENVGKSLTNAMHFQDELIADMEKEQPNAFSSEQQAHLKKARTLLHSLYSDDSLEAKTKELLVEMALLRQELELIKVKLRHDSNNLDSKD
jgi:Spy/CpxP family protein refolding chaperone